MPPSWPRAAGLRMPLLPTAFDALCWGIIGQQINVKFATSLRRDLVELAGEKIGTMRAHPTPEAVANLDAGELTRRRYSGSKTRYLIDAAQAIADKRLDIEGLRRRLGPGGGKGADRPARHRHLDGALCADARRLCRCGAGGRQRAGDGAAETAQAAGTSRHRRHRAADGAFAPHRSLATMHLWTYLKEARMTTLLEPDRHAVPADGRLGG